jgi:hypothetical protein
MFAVREGDQSFAYTLPGGALATFTWGGQPPGTAALRQISPVGWTATAEPPGPSDPCCAGDVAANAVDGDASTRYSTGTAQAPGQYVQVDFGSALPRPAGRLRHRRFGGRLPAWLRRHDQPGRHAVDDSGGRPGQWPVHDRRSWRCPGPVRTRHADRGCVDLVERRRHPRIHLTAAPPPDTAGCSHRRAGATPETRQAGTLGVKRRSWSPPWLTTP